MSMMVNPYRFAAGGVSPTDPDWANVVFLSGYEGADASASFIDESSFARALTAKGNCQCDTSIKKFGSSAALFDGSGDAITATNSADFDLDADDFTIESWCYFSTVNNVARVLASKWGASGSRGWQFVWNGGASPDVLQFYLSTTGSNTVVVLSDAWTPTVNTWYHLCVDRSGDVFRSYVDGVMLGKATNSSTIYAPSAEMAIGGAAGSYAFIGSMDETRITQGVARYGSDGGYAVPAAAFPRS